MKKVLIVAGGVLLAMVMAVGVLFGAVRWQQSREHDAQEAAAREANERLEADLARRLEEHARAAASDPLTWTATPTKLEAAVREQIKWDMGRETQTQVVEVFKRTLGPPLASYEDGFGAIMTYVWGSPPVSTKISDIRATPFSASMPRNLTCGDYVSGAVEYYSFGKRVYLGDAASSTPVPSSAAAADSAAPPVPASMTVAAPPGPPDDGPCSSASRTCNSDLFVQLASPQPTAPADFDYPLTRNVIDEHGEFGGIKLVETHVNGHRVMGALVKNECQAQRLIDVVDAAMRSHPHSVCQAIAVTRVVKQY